MLVPKGGRGDPALRRIFAGAGCMRQELTRLFTLSDYDGEGKVV